MIKLLREIRDLLASIDRRLAAQAPASYVVQRSPITAQETTALRKQFAAAVRDSNRIGAL